MNVSELILLGLLSMAALSDMREHKIYNWTTYPVILCGAVISLLVSGLRYNNLSSEWLGSLGVLQFLMGAIGCGLLMTIPYSLARGGGGDVKLAAAMGGLLGFEGTLWALGCGYIVAATWIVSMSTYSGGLKVLAPALARGGLSFIAPQHVAPPSSQQRKLLQRPFPLASCFAAGVVIVLLVQT